MWSSFKRSVTGLPSSSSQRSQTPQEVQKQKKIIKDKTDVAIELISNYLIQFHNEARQLQQSDRILMELEGVKGSYSDGNDKMVVNTVIEGIKKYGSEQVTKDIGTDKAEKISPEAAKILRELFEDFENAFRYRDVEEKKDESTVKKGLR